jgi:hypothetical protein
MVGRRCQRALLIVFAGGDVAHADVGDVGQAVLSQRVLLVQLPPWCVAVARAELHVDVLGNLQAAVGLNRDVIVQRAVAQVGRASAQHQAGADDDGEDDECAGQRRCQRAEQTFQVHGDLQ